MNEPAQQLAFGPGEYLAWEEGQPTRNEYVNGEVFAMTGASEAHNLVAGNLYIVLRNHLKGGDCKVFMTDMKLQVEQANAFFYPDLMVTCGPESEPGQNWKSAPLLVVEVLSPSTEGYDRGEKFAHYRKLPSLREYLLIDPQHPGVELFRLNDSGHWVLYPYTFDQTLELSSLSLEIPVSDLFEDVELPA